MGKSRLGQLKMAAMEFVAAEAITVSEKWNAVKFRFGSRVVTVSLGADNEEGFTVLVDSDYEGVLRFEAVLVEKRGYKSLLLCRPDYCWEDGKRQSMVPGPSYSLLALGVVVAHVVGYHLYGILCNLADSIKSANRLLAEINEDAGAEKIHSWDENPKLLSSLVEAYAYLVEIYFGLVL
jgi:hypothetical protein